MIVRLNGVASTRVVNDFPGLYASAYILERPILNALQPAFALDETLISSSCKHQFKFNVLLVALILTFINLIIKN